MTSANRLNERHYYYIYINIIIERIRRNAEKTFILICLCIMWLDLELENVSLQFASVLHACCVDATLISANTEMSMNISKSFSLTSDLRVISTAPRNELKLNSALKNW